MLGELSSFALLERSQRRCPARWLVGVPNKRWSDIELLTRMNEHAEAGSIDKTRFFFREQQKQGRPLHRVVWNTLLKAYANAGDHWGAVQVFGEMQRDGLVPNQKSMGKLIKSAGKSKEVSLTEAWFSMTPSVYRLQPTVFQYCIVQDVCAKVSDTLRACEWFRRMAANGLDACATSYRILILGSATEVNPSLAKKYFERMTSASLEVDVLTHTDVLHAYAQSGDAVQVDEWLVQMKKAGVTPTTVTYNVGLNCHAKRGNSAQAARLLEEMIKVGAEPDEKSYTTVIDGFARNGEGRQALHLFEKMKRRGISPDEAAYTSVIDSFAKAGDVKQAVEWLTRLSRERTPGVIAYNVVLNAYAKRRDWATTMQTIRTMDRDRVRLDRRSFTTVIDSCARSRHPEESNRWLERMMSDSVTPDLITFGTVINCCAMSSDTSRAILVLDTMTEAALADPLTASLMVPTGMDTDQHVETAKDVRDADIDRLFTSKRKRKARDSVKKVVAPPLTAVPAAPANHDADLQEALKLIKGEVSNNARTRTKRKARKIAETKAANGDSESD